MIYLSQIILIISITIASSHTYAANAPKSSNIIFGNPIYQDCLKAFNHIPYATNPTSKGAEHYQLYSEPQYLFPPFTAVTNRYRPRSINQLPKIWRSNTCRVAIMSYGWPSGAVRSSLFSAPWSSILAQMTPVVEFTNPGSQSRPCGGWSPFLLPKNQQPVAALYVYSSYSPFEDLVNTYMSSGNPVVPPVTTADIRGLLSNASYARDQMGLSMFDSVPPVAPQDITVLD